MIVGTLPNILTILRILLLPFFATSLIYSNYQYALILFITAAITDVLDGLIARITKQVTDFGSILDPVADKFLVITSFIVMTVNGLIPTWLTITVISKDIIIVTGWLILYFVTHNKKVEPSILGKAANFFQVCLIALVLIAINTRNVFSVPESYFIAVAVLTAASGIFYIYRGLKIAHIQH